MKKLLLLLSVVLIITAVGCDKETKQTSDDKGEISFTTTNIPADKDGGIDCETEVHYALIYIDGEEYKLDVFMFDGMLTTQALKFGVGEHTLQDFILMNHNGTPDDYADDVPVSAAVHYDAPYSEYVDFTVHHDFFVEPFVKKDLHVEVICVQEGYYEPFGFEYFTVWETVIRRQYFFWDICVPCLDEYYGSAYENASTGVLLDNSAIIKIDVFRNNNYVNSFTNWDQYGEEVVCVEYADRLNEADCFLFELYTWLPVGDHFEWVHTYTYQFCDDEMLDSGEDGVNEGVIGNCVYEASGIILDQYVNLPATVTFELDGQVGPSPLNGYFDITFSGIAPGYHLENGTFPSFCADANVFISLETPYLAEVYHTLNLLEAISNTNLDATQLMMLHWLANHFEDYGYDLSNLGNGQWAVVQNVIWAVTDNVALLPGDATTIHADAVVGHPNYNPLPNTDEQYFVILYVDGEVQLQVKDLDTCPEED
jgi:hypothetical protein